MCANLAGGQKDQACSTKDSGGWLRLLCDFIRDDLNIR